MKPYRRISDKYYEIYKPYFKYSYKNGYVLEHRYIYHIYLSIKYNRIIYLPKSYDIHHINKNTLDNRIENLKLLTRKQHKYEDKNPEILNRKCNLCHKKHKQWLNDIDGFICIICHVMVLYYRKKFGII